MHISVPVFSSSVNRTRMQTTSEVGLCGTTRWKAAKAASKSMTNLDETGLEVAGCRHALALNALNMFRGEM